MSTTAERWQADYDATVGAIERHPAFGRLVRLVAKSEAVRLAHPRYFWYARNSYTYGAWMKRVMPDYGNTARRALALAAAVTDDLFADRPPNPREWNAMVYATAQRWVRERRVTR